MSCQFVGVIFVDFRSRFGRWSNSRGTTCKKEICHWCGKTPSSTTLTSCGSKTPAGPPWSRWSIRQTLPKRCHCQGCSVATSTGKFVKFRVFFYVWATFRRKLKEVCFPKMSSAKIRCYELFCVHLGLVTASCVLEHTRRLAATIWELRGLKAHPIDLLWN